MHLDELDSVFEDHFRVVGCFILNQVVEESLDFGGLVRFGLR
jgi:hypothetical protein